MIHAQPKAVRAAALKAGTDEEGNSLVSLQISVNRRCFLALINPRKSAIVGLAGFVASQFPDVDAFQLTRIAISAINEAGVSC